MGRNKNFQGSDISELKQTIRTLKGSLTKERRKNERLVSEIKTLQRAFNESVLYINDELAGIPVEQIVKYFKDKKAGRLKDVTDEQHGSLERLKQKWQCYGCGEGYMRLVVLDRHDGKKYFRICSEADCNHRTRLKDYHEGVEGLV